VIANILQSKYNLKCLKLCGPFPQYEISSNLWNAYIHTYIHTYTLKTGKAQWVQWMFIIIFSGSAAQRGLWPPRPRGFLISHNDVSQSVGLLWTSDHAETSTWQHTTHTKQKNIHAPGGIRTHDRSRRATIGLRLRPRGHGDQPNGCFNCLNIFYICSIRIL
jgi:hypothetical protein